MYYIKVIDVVESFINGNFSYVKKHITSIKDYQRVLDYLEEIAPERAESFKKIIGGK